MVKKRIADLNIMIMCRVTILLRFPVLANGSNRGGTRMEITTTSRKLIKRLTSVSCTR